MSSPRTAHRLLTISHLFDTPDLCCREVSKSLILLLTMIDCDDADVLDALKSMRLQIAFTKLVLVRQFSFTVTPTPSFSTISALSNWSKADGTITDGVEVARQLPNVPIPARHSKINEKEIYV